MLAQLKNDVITKCRLIKTNNKRCDDTSPSQAAEYNGMLLYPLTLPTLPTTQPPNQRTAMPGGYWSLHGTERSRVCNAHWADAASTENYRYRDARLGMVSGKCVKCLDRALGERCKLRWGNYRAAIFQSHVTNFRGKRQSWSEEGSTVSVGANKPQSLERWSADNDLKLRSNLADKTSRYHWKAARLRCDDAREYVSFSADPACPSVHVFVLSFTLKSLPLLHTWNSIFHWCSAEAFTYYYNKGCVLSPGCG